MRVEEVLLELRQRHHCVSAVGPARVVDHARAWNVEFNSVACIRYYRTCVLALHVVLVRYRYM